MGFLRTLSRINKITFFKEKKCDVIFLDENLLGLKSKNLKYKNIKFNEINVFIFIQTIFNFLLEKRFFSFKNLYFLNMLNQLKPRVIIGHNLNQRIFLVKKLFPSAITICYQFGFLDKRNIHKIYKKKDKDNFCDYFLVFHKQDAIILKKFFKSKFIVVGSVRNNNYKSNKKSKKNLINYISQYNPKKPKNHKHHFYQSYLLNVLKNYCISKKITLAISPRSNRIDKPLLNLKKEKKYYDDMIGNSYILSNHSAYEFPNKAALNVTLHSNLGFELLSRGEKVFFFQPDKKIYFYPYKINRNSVHFYNRLNKKIIEKKIKSLINLSNNKWLNYYNKIDKIYYDENNKILMKIIKLELSKK